MTDEIIVLITTANKNDAEAISFALVNEHLAACVNIIPAIRSLFFWEGKVQDEQEILLVIKSRLHLLDHLIARVKDLHSYTVPEILALPIIGGSPEYLSWLRTSTRE